MTPVSKATRSGEAPLSIQLAQTPADFNAVEFLVRRYVEWLGLDLSFQSFEEEINNLAGKYSPPFGSMFLAQIGGRGVGCVGFATIRYPETCEAKRLFVLPEERGHRIAHALVSKLLSAAEATGYKEIFLDTLPTMTAAIRLYESFGFERVGPYYPNPIETALFFRKSFAPGLHNHSRTAVA